MGVIKKSDAPTKAFGAGAPKGRGTAPDAPSSSAQRDFGAGPAKGRGTAGKPTSTKGSQFEEGLKKNPAAKAAFDSALRQKGPGGQAGSTLIGGDPTRYNAIDTTYRTADGKLVYTDSQLGQIHVTTPPPISHEDLLRLEASNPNLARQKTRELRDWQRSQGIGTSGIGSEESTNLIASGYDMPAIELAIQQGRLTPQEVRQMAGLGNSPFGSVNDPVPAWVTERRAAGMPVGTALPTPQPIHTFATQEEADAYRNAHYYEAHPGMTQITPGGGVNVANRTYGGQQAPAGFGAMTPQQLTAALNANPALKEQFASAYYAAHPDQVARPANDQATGDTTFGGVPEPEATGDTTFRGTPNVDPRVLLEGQQMAQAQSLPNATPTPNVDPRVVLDAQTAEGQRPVVPAPAVPKEVSPGGSPWVTPTGVSQRGVPPPAAAPAQYGSASSYAPPQGGYQQEAAQAPIPTKGDPAQGSAWDYNGMIDKLDGIQQALKGGFQTQQPATKAGSGQAASPAVRPIYTAMPGAADWMNG